MLDERLGKWHFWLFLIGFHVCFDVMHIPGVLGMPRSIYTYEADRGWTGLNQIVSVGAIIQAIAVAILVYNMIHSVSEGCRTRDPIRGMHGRWSGSRTRLHHLPITLPSNQWFAAGGRCGT